VLALAICSLFLNFSRSVARVIDGALVQPEHQPQGEEVSCNASPPSAQSGSETASGFRAVSGMSKTGSRRDRVLDGSSCTPPSKGSPR